MNLETGIIIGGILSIGLAIFHLFFHRYFKWVNDLKKISVVNARIFNILHIGIIALFVFYAVISFVFTKELSQCIGLAGVVVGFYTLLWLVRLILQVVYLQPMQKEKPYLHFILITCFVLLFTVYFIPIALKLF